VLGHDGLDPAELRARGRAELARYGVQVVPLEAQDAQGGVARDLGGKRVGQARSVVEVLAQELDQAGRVPGREEPLRLRRLQGLHRISSLETRARTSV